MSLLGPSVFLSSGDVCVGELLELHQGCQGPFRVSEGRWDFSRKATAEKGLISPGGEILLIFLKLGQAPLELQRAVHRLTRVASGRPVSMLVVRGLSGFLSSRSRVLRPHLESRPEPEVSSPVLTWILGFLWSLERGVRPLLEWRHVCPLSS